MPWHDDDTLRLRLRPPRARGSGRTAPFVQQLLQVARGPLRKGLPSQATLQRTGRGHVAATTKRSSGDRYARRVVVKARLVVLAQAGARATSTHLRYLEREGVDADGQQGHAYDALHERVDVAAFEARGREDRHQFRFIVSAEDAAELGDLRRFTRELMAGLEQDLGTRLEWVAVDHWDTDNPHTHIVLHGRDQRGQDLVIARSYIGTGMRERAGQLATQWLGPRTERELQAHLEREVGKARFTTLDRQLLQSAKGHTVSLADLSGSFPRTLAIGRLQRLETMGLATPSGIGEWTLAPQVESTLRGLGERGDIVRSMQRALGSARRELVLRPSEDASQLVGRVAGRGLAADLHDQPFLVIDGVDGRAHYVRLPGATPLEAYPMDSVVAVDRSAAPRPADGTIASVAQDGAYRPSEHLRQALTRHGSTERAEAFVAAHVRRLEALRRAGIVDRIQTDEWRIPADLVQRGAAFDARGNRSGRATVVCPVSINTQVKAMAETWLDRELVHATASIATSGFGREVRVALEQRRTFLGERGLSKLTEGKISDGAQLLATLRRSEVAAAGQAIAEGTKLRYEEPQSGKSFSGIFRKRVSLVSGSYALIAGNTSFSLVPCERGMGRHLGRTLYISVQGPAVQWAPVSRSLGI